MGPGLTSVLQPPPRPHHRRHQPHHHVHRDQGNVTTGV